MFYSLSEQDMAYVVECLMDFKEWCVFHYVPLHTSPAGQKFGVFHGEDKYTTKESERLMRLPMFYSLSEQDMAYVVECLMDFKEW
jgi:dTDP-4-amino-4,6-dideoxygalactose transaminase